MIYGRGAKSIAAQIDQPVEEAQKIIDGFYNAYPIVKKWMDNSVLKAKTDGYVTTICGRRRHLDDMKLNVYELIDKTSPNNNETVLFEEVKLKDISREDILAYYRDKLDKCKNKSKKLEIIKEAESKNILVQDNYKKISAATRQTVNSRIQGSAADLSKKAMIDIYNNEELRKLGFTILYPVHDEIAGQCPVENADRVAELLKEVMIKSAATICDVPMKVDCYVVKHWYLDELSNVVKKRYNKLIEEKGYSAEDAFKQIDIEYPEIKIETLQDMCNGTIDLKTAILAR